MTEDEAKTKACCASFSPVSFTSTGIAGGISQTIDPRNCIGSACMAWRWIDKAGTKDDGTPNYYPGHWQGYCGLAGRP